MKRDEDKKMPIDHIAVWESKDLQEMLSLIQDSTSGIETYIQRLQKWGKYPDSDMRYYLHMVFRYYLHEYHKEAVVSGIVIEYPSYQIILDKISPNGCKTGFPPDFSRFIKESSGRCVPVYTLPVPKKGCGKIVVGDFNFEKNAEVVTIRRTLYTMFQGWMSSLSNGVCIYPSFLHKGHDGNSEIQAEFYRMKELEHLRFNMYRIKGIDGKKMTSLLENCPDLKHLHKRYMEHKFVTHGEQLSERFGFFIFYRKLFSEIEKHKMSEELFGDRRMDMYTHFKTFCTLSRGIANLERDQMLCRELLMLFTDIAYTIYLFCNKNIGMVDSSEIVRKCIGKFK